MSLTVLLDGINDTNGAWRKIYQLEFLRGFHCMHSQSVGGKLLCSDGHLGRPKWKDVMFVCLFLF